MSLLDNLISYWKLDEASGDALDSHSSNDLTETSINGTVGSTTGKINSARDFEATDRQHFSRADNTDLSTGDIDFTFACWLLLENADSGTYRCAAGKQNSGQTEWYLWNDRTTGGGGNPNRLKFTVSHNGSTEASVSANTFGALSTGVWYHVVAWHDSANNVIGISVNDVADTASHSAGVFDGTAEFTLGAIASLMGDADAVWDGLIDEAGFWKRVLTSDERTQLYNSGDGQSYDDFGGGGGLSATINQVVETDLAQPIGKVKTKVIAQISETDLAQVLNRIKSRILGQTSETDIANAVSWSPKNRLVNQIVETDLAQALTRIKTKQVGQVAETDEAQQVIRAGVAQSVNQVTETDLAQAISETKSKAIVQATETDLAQQLNRSKAKAVNQTTETDVAQSLSRSKVKVVNQVVEVDVANVVTWSPKIRIIGQATETDTALTITPTTTLVVTPSGKAVSIYVYCAGPVESSVYLPGSKSTKLNS